MLRLGTFNADVRGVAVSSTPIGTTTPAAGSFTTIKRTGTEVETNAIIVPVTGNTVAIAAGVMVQIINPAGILATLTVTTPPAPVNTTGTIQRLTIVFMTAITTLTWTAGSGTTSSGAALPATVAIGGVVNLIWVQSLSQWVHVTNA